MIFHHLLRLFVQILVVLENLQTLASLFAYTCKSSTYLLINI